MKTAFLFPGQGSQSVEMGKDLYNKYEEYRDVYKKIDNIVGKKIENTKYIMANLLRKTWQVPGLSGLQQAGSLRPESHLKE